MFETLINGFKLGSATRKLVFKDKRLLLYPILMGITALAEFFVILGGSIIAGGELATSAQSSYILLTTLAIGIILFYLISTFTTTYLTIAMLLSFREFAKGKEASIGTSISSAKPYAKLAFEWAVFYSTVVLLLNIIESRFRGAANFIISAVGSLALTVAIMFAIPVIIDQKVGPIKAIEASAKTLVGHFGATFGGIVYTELYGLIVIILGALIIIGGIFSSSASLALGVLIAAIGFILVVFGMILGFSLSTIFRFILYEYVNGKPLPEGFDENLIKAGIKKNNSILGSVL